MTDIDEGVLLKPLKVFDETSLADVAGILAYKGKPKKLSDMADAIRLGVKSRGGDRR